MIVSFEIVTVTENSYENVYEIESISKQTLSEGKRDSCYEQIDTKNYEQVEILSATKDMHNVPIYLDLKENDIYSNKEDAKLFTIVRAKIITNIMPTHVKTTIKYSLHQLLFNSFLAL